MPIVDHSQTDAIKQVDCLIKGHLVDEAIEFDDHRPVAPIGRSDLMSMAKQANVEVDFVEQRLRTICEQIGSKEGVPTYEMKVIDE